MTPPTGAHGDPLADAFDRLWTPHRMAYIRGENKPVDAAAGDGCPFCLAPRMQDRDESLVVAQGEFVYAVLNRYPYNAGHLLVCPYEHLADYIALSEPALAEFTAFTTQCVRVLTEVARPAGFNIGMNQGGAAGAGIAAHLHQHIVPRWGGDTNFMPVVAGTRVLPEILVDTRRLLSEAWLTVGIGGG
ncbi:MAG TPA: HIT family hydrolase [Actinobacteria bacterium]|nr:HIT family hydrolase [Actinomycetota bacterium]HCK79153.1 HIT family hydrolase [Actinomycetota bacterium]